MFIIIIRPFFTPPVREILVLDLTMDLRKLWPGTVMSLVRFRFLTKAPPCSRRGGPFSPALKLRCRITLGMISPSSPPKNAIQIRFMSTLRRRFPGSFPTECRILTSMDGFRATATAAVESFAPFFFVFPPLIRRKFDLCMPAGKIRKFGCGFDFQVLLLSFPPPFSVCFFFNWAAGSLNEDEIGGGEIEEEERKNKTL